MRKLTIALLFLLADLPAVAFIGDTTPGAGVSYPPPYSGTFAYNSYIPPNTPGASYVDPVFGETVRRITTDHVCDDIYARNMFWNANDTRYLHIWTDGNSVFFVVIDVATGAVTHSGIPVGMGWLSGNAGFDPIDPNVLYYYETDGIHKVTLGLGGSWMNTLYWTPPGGAQLGNLGGTLNWLDASGRYMLVRYGPEPSVYLYDRQNLSQPYANPINYSTYNYLGLSPDGQFIVGFENPPTGTYHMGQSISWRIDHATRTVPTSPTVFWSVCGGHGAFISASDGRNYMVVGACNAQPGIWRVDITNNAFGLDETAQEALPNNRMILAVSWADGMHMASTARGDWTFISTEDGSDTVGSGTADANGNITPWHAYRQEILAIDVISGAIRRLAHHRSRFFDCPPDGDPNRVACMNNLYCTQPRISASWNGKVVGYASNFNQVVGFNSTVDVYAIPFDPGTPPPPPGPVARWPLDEGSGLTAADVTGNGHTGSLVNGPTWVAGRSGQALSFDGVDDYVQVSHAADLNPFPLTVTAWIRTTTTVRAGIVNKYVASSLSGYNLYTENGQLCAWYFRDASNHTWDGTTCTLAVAGANDGNWHHVAFVVDATQARLYLDGTLRTTQVWTGSPGATSTTQPISLARYPGATPTSFLPGSLDDVRVYNRALTQAEISALAQ